ncbi:MAG: rRNA maturation RNase YbeY [Lachnospiraceae bacterium]|nr:rRNA maturation RNase YbeY [Lachnospiraceae bacterium]
MSVYFDNEIGDRLSERYKSIVLEIVDASLEYLNCPYECEVNVLFTDDEGIRQINNEFREIDAPTDVLSFPLIDYQKPADFEKLEDNPYEFFNQDTGELMLGDIVLNVDRILKQAKEYNHSEYREVAFLTAHSMLHLAGYDHIEDEERIIMEDLQEKILNMKGYMRDYEEN